jgi:23S rRNA-/tRNA-specific pseudouridylate synthase
VEKKKLFFFPSIKVAVINIDDLYGKKANRLHLHAESLTFEHPVSKKLITLKAEIQFYKKG